MKKLVITILLGLLLICSFGLIVCGENAQGLEFRLKDDGTYEVYCGTVKEMSSIKIPAIYKGSAVTSIGYQAFSGCSGLTSITIPNSVTSIGIFAFYNCSSLTSINISDGVTSIENSAFSGCSSLETITVDENNKKYRSENNCLIENETNTLILGCKNSIIPNSVTSIEGMAFYYCCNLTSVTIPDSVTSIGERAFEGCSSLTSVTIPDSGTRIGYNAFYNCPCVKTSKGVSYVDKWLIKCDSNVTSVTIKEDTVGIANYAFYECRSLTSITIPDSVTSIGNGAFSGCSRLTSIIIPDSVTSIGYEVFSCYINLTSVYYTGTSEDWGNITIDSDNYGLTHATRYFYLESEPTAGGHYWHYIDGEIAVWQNQSTSGIWSIFGTMMANGEEAYLTVENNVVTIKRPLAETDYKGVVFRNLDVTGLDTDQTHIDITIQNNTTGTVEFYYKVTTNSGVDTGSGSGIGFTEHKVAPAGGSAILTCQLFTYDQSNTGATEINMVEIFIITTASSGTIEINIQEHIF